MPRKPRGASRQPELFERSKRPTIPIDPNHRLVLLTDETDWTELEERVEEIRMNKLKSAAGRPPHLRALIGALVLKATRDMTWREAEPDQPVQQSDAWLPATSGSPGGASSPSLSALL